MAFRSILFDGGAGESGEEAGEAPDFFHDLALDQVFASVTAGREAYDLLPLFQATLPTVAAIAYRHEVFGDLENRERMEAVNAFAAAMGNMRSHLARVERARYQYERERWFLDAAGAYCGAVIELQHALTTLQPASRGLTALGAYLTTYVSSPAFTSLLADSRQATAALAAVRYRLHVTGNRVAVSPLRSEPDYSVSVLETFEKFKQGAGKVYRFNLAVGPDMNHVEAEIVQRVALVHPEAFARLDRFSQQHAAFLDSTLARFDREAQFYCAWLEHLDRLRTPDLAFCYPEVSDRSKEIRGRSVFDIALAASVVNERTSVVTNDFDLHEPERILVVSGPNQGGKTTFARTVGQLHYLASIGCPVPGTEARLFLVDRVFSHFEREEDLQNLSGKLEDDLRRIQRILERATARSLVVMNESFTSTTVSDAIFLNKKILQQIIELDVICVCVTFLDELATLGETTVSMVSQVDPDDPARRTFKVVRRPADGLAYAWAIAEKHRLTYDGVRGRIAR